MWRMSAPLFTAKTASELRSERDELESEMEPNTIDMLRRLSHAGVLTFDEQEKLDRYESLTWLIGD